MCRGDLTKTAEIVMAEVISAASPQKPHPAQKPEWAPSEIFFAILTAFVAFVLVLLGIGIAANGPEPLIPYAIIVIPAFLITAVRLGIKRARGKPIGWGERLATFLISAAVVVSVITVLIAAAIVAFCIYCFSALANGKW